MTFQLRVLIIYSEYSLLNRPILKHFLITSGNELTLLTSPMCKDTLSNFRINLVICLLMYCFFFLLICSARTITKHWIKNFQKYPRIYTLFIMYENSWKCCGGCSEIAPNGYELIHWLNRLARSYVDEGTARTQAHCHFCVNHIRGLSDAVLSLPVVFFCIDSTLAEIRCRLNL